MKNEDLTGKPIDLHNIPNVLYIINNDYKWELFVKDAYGMSQDISLTSIIDKIKLEKFNSPSDYYKKNHLKEDTVNWNDLSNEKRKFYIDKFNESKRKYAYDIILVKKYLFYYIKEDLKTIYDTIDIYINEQLIIAYENGDVLDPKIYRKKWSKLSDNIKNQYENIRNKLIDIFKNCNHYGTVTCLNFYQKINSPNLNISGQEKLQILNQKWKELSDDEKLEWHKKALISNIEHERQIELKHLIKSNCITFRYSNEFDIFNIDFKKYYTPYNLSEKYWDELSVDIKYKYKSKFHRLLLTHKFKTSIYKNFNKNNKKKKRRKKKFIKGGKEVENIEDNNELNEGDVQINYNNIDEDEELIYTKPPNALGAFAFYIKYNYNKIITITKSKDKNTLIKKGAELYKQLNPNDKKLYENLQNESEELYKYRLDSFNKFKYYDAKKTLASYKKDEQDHKEIEKIFEDALKSIDDDDINDLKDLDNVSLHKPVVQEEKVKENEPKRFKKNPHIQGSYKNDEGMVILKKNQILNEPLDLDEPREQLRDNNNTNLDINLEENYGVNSNINTNNNLNDNQKENVNHIVNVNSVNENNIVKKDISHNINSINQDDFPPSILIYKDLLQKNSIQNLLLNNFPKAIIDIYLNYLVNKPKKNTLDPILEKLKSDLLPSANVDENNKIITDADLENESQSNNNDIQVNNDDIQANNDDIQANVIENTLSNISEIQNNDDLLSDSKHYIYSKASAHNTVIDDPIDFNDYDNQLNSEEISVLNDLYNNKAIIKIDNDIVPINNKQPNDDEVVKQAINNFINNPQYHININLNDHHEDKNKLLMSKTFKPNHNLNLNVFKNEEYHSKKKFVKCHNLNNILNNNNPEDYLNKNTY